VRVNNRITDYLSSVRSTTLLLTQISMKKTRLG
jgi:hypothetical protein